MTTIEEIIEATVRRVLDQEARPIVEKILGETLANVGAVLKARGPEATPVLGDANADVGLENGGAPGEAKAVRMPSWTTAPSMASARVSRIQLPGLGSSKTVSIHQAAKAIGVQKGRIYWLIRTGALESAGRMKPRRAIPGAKRRASCLYVTAASVEKFLANSAK